MESSEIDPLDREILGELATSGRLSWRELGQRVGLSANATADRVRRLEQRGVITGYAARVDPTKVGRGLEAIVSVKMHASAEREPFEEFVAAHDAVTDAVHLTGEDDYVMQVSCRDAAELDEILTALKRERGVADTNTRVVLRRIQS